MTAAGPQPSGTWPELGRAVLARPGLWPVAFRAGRALIPRGWWRRPPFLPVPDRDYLHFRLVTAYGGGGTTPPRSDDLVTWLEWLRNFPR